MEDILLVHRKSNLKIPAEVVWKTCLRQIAFFSETSFQLSCEEDDQILRGSKALGFLLEVLTGLQSPVLGETEVFGQFRLFIEARRQAGDPLFSENRRWLNFLLTEVKRIRTSHIGGLGSNSYGGIVRAQTKTLDQISVLGTGHLAKEILPWLTQKQLKLVGRQPEKMVLADYKFKNLCMETYGQLTGLGQAVVIAAPLQDEELMRLVNTYGSELRKIFDLRGESNQLKSLLSQTAIEVSSLDDMFAELAGSRKDNEEKVTAAKKVILQRVDQFMERSELRPMGWDDICA